MRRIMMGMVLAVAGCGPAEKADVSGKVRFDGKLMASGTVTFLGSDGARSYSAIGSGGEYSVRGVARGEAKISVVSHPFVPSGIANPGGAAKPDDGSIKIPPRYKDAPQSPLSVTVTGPGQKYDIDLTP